MRGKWQPGQPVSQSESTVRIEEVRRIIGLRHVKPSAVPISYFQPLLLQHSFRNHPARPTTSVHRPGRLADGGQ